MSTFKAAPWNLNDNDLVSVQVSAHNSRGSATPSLANL